MSDNACIVDGCDGERFRLKTFTATPRLVQIETIFLKMEETVRKELAVFAQPILMRHLATKLEFHAPRFSTLMLQ